MMFQTPANGDFKGKDLMDLYRKISPLFSSLDEARQFECFNFFIMGICKGICLRQAQQCDPL